MADESLEVAISVHRPYFTIGFALESMPYEFTLNHYALRNESFRPHLALYILNVH